VLHDKAILYWVKNEIPQSALVLVSALTTDQDDLLSTTNFDSFMHSRNKLHSTAVTSYTNWRLLQSSANDENLLKTINSFRHRIPHKTIYQIYLMSIKQEITDWLIDSGIPEMNVTNLCISNSNGERQCLCCCNPDTATARVHPVYLMNVAQVLGCHQPLDQANQHEPQICLDW